MTNVGKEDNSGIDSLEFQRFRNFLQEICGISLSPDKRYLVANRMRRIMAENRFSNLTQLLISISKGTNHRVRQQVIDAMTTNETYWFRDTYPFEFVAKSLLPALYQEKKGAPVRIWSAACSSGQEPYSLSMAVEEYFESGAMGLRFPVEIIATDVATNVLEQARKAEYDTLMVTRGLSPERLQRFFDPVAGGRWRITSAVKSRVQFRLLNLQNSYSLLGKCDIVFCRNVLIYFSAHLKRDILKKIHSVMAPGGYLFLGSSESLGDADDLFEVAHCQPGIAYRAK